MLTLFTCQCALGHNGVHFFDTSTSKSVPRLTFFLHFSLPNVLRATSNGNRIVKKWSEPPVLLTCSLPNVLRATTACTFSTSQRPKVVRTWCVLHMLTSICASRPNSVHFFDISTSKSDPTLTYFSHFDFHMCFAPQRRAIVQIRSHKTLENTVLRDFLTFSRNCTLSLLTVSLPDLLHLLSFPF